MIDSLERTPFKSAIDRLRNRRPKVPVIDASRPLEEQARDVRERIEDILVRFDNGQIDGTVTAFNWKFKDPASNRIIKSPYRMDLSDHGHRIFERNIANTLGDQGFISQNPDGVKRLLEFLRSAQ